MTKVHRGEYENSPAEPVQDAEGPAGFPESEEPCGSMMEGDEMGRGGTTPPGTEYLAGRQWKYLPVPGQVSGRFRGQTAQYLLELRVDVDGDYPLDCVSGDLYRFSGKTLSYYSSFLVQPITKTEKDSVITILGEGEFTRKTTVSEVKVVVRKGKAFSDPPSPATVSFLNKKGKTARTMICNFESRYFRSVEWEQDYVKDITMPVFSSYNTGSLPQGGTARNLSVIKAYAEAGIEMRVAGIADAIPIAEAGSNTQWSDAELHASMIRHFSLWADVPQWKVWLLVAQEHEPLDGGGELLGIMFDDIGKHRQGCAVFHKGLGGTKPEQLRNQLFCYVHELGHCFNLMHSWQKIYSEPPRPNRPTSLSWMNYPWYHPAGEAGFWAAFGFRFDDQEILHLRHAFRNSIIMGGNDFSVGAALEDRDAFSKPIEDNSGLKLEVRSKKSFALGEPVVVELKLSTTDLRGVKVYEHLHPKTGFVQIGIRKPSGQIHVYEPLIEHCLAPGTTVLDTQQPAIYDSAFISYGKFGQYFDEVGTYQLRGVYSAMDGSIVASDIHTLRVQAPHSSTDEEVVDLFMGDEQGILLYLLGSDSEFLQRGNEAFETMISDYGENPLAPYAQLVRGINSGRTFKTITQSKDLTVRKSDAKTATSLLSDVADASEKGAGVDNITLNMTLRRLAGVQRQSGDAKSARHTADRMLEIFSKKGLRPQVMLHIEAQAEALKKQK